MEKMEEVQPIKIETSKKITKPSIKNGVWLATYKEETEGNQWFKHTGPGKINATYTTLLAIQAYAMVKGKLPAFVCNYSTAKATGETIGFHECTKVIDHDMYLGPKQYETPDDTIPGIIGWDHGITVGSRDSIFHYIAHKDPDIQAIDSTAYAIAKMCKEMKVDFRCYKYITKNVPHGNEHEAWLADCKKGAKLLRKMCENRFGDVNRSLYADEKEGTKLLKEIKENKKQGYRKNE